MYAPQDIIRLQIDQAVPQTQEVAIRFAGITTSKWNEAAGTSAPGSKGDLHHSDHSLSACILWGNLEEAY